MKKPSVRKKKKKKKAVETPLFPDSPEQLTPGSMSVSTDGQVWTEQKAQLIARYLRLFVYITKHGAYIDGFSAPKEPDYPDTWAAKLVAESEPKWFRQFFLCDLPNRTHLLDELVASQQPVAKRTFRVVAGDFNQTVHEVLASPDISGRTATFCLLDQFNVECQWRTVRALAAHKGPGFNKIEMFYFLAAGWVFRSLEEFKDEALPAAWWGRDDWRCLLGIGQSRLALMFQQRFQDELGYRFVNSYPIYKRERGRGRIMFYMIHASDHPEAPVLMRRAYNNVIQPLETHEQLMMEYGTREA